MASPVASIASPSRVIRVFVSSTFRDMEAERDELVKRTFPQLRKLCETRGVTWGEVDLRWGVTDEQKSEGKVLPICLAEIRRCRPYFIGLLGERYGWVPEDIPQGLQDEERWLGALRGRSVTELEILHGVLNDPAMAENAFFYFRSPAYLDSLPHEQRFAFQETSTPEDIERFGAKEAARRAEVRKEKLIALKQRLRGSGLPVREDYPNPQALGQLVLADLTSVIDRGFPDDSTPDPLDREAAEHEALAQSRARIYIGRREYFDRLDDHAHSNAPPLVILGESGLGKSALLANWAMRYRAAHPDDLLVQHFIGATPASADWAAMLRRILGEFKRRFGLTLEIPDEAGALRLAFANALHMVAAKGRVVLILDALNQLEDSDQAPDLVWLPPVMPGNVRLILSTLAGRPLDDLKKRGWPVLQVEPLTTGEREQLVNKYLAQYSKSLSAGRVERIAATPQTANPLYLRALLEELRLWGEHETLDAGIDHYLSAVTIDQLYESILERYERDYERDRPGLVRDAMSLVWAARRGLSEAELMDLLGEGAEPLPRAYWSPLYLAAEQSLVNRSGLIGFSHNYFREAVRDKYLPIEQKQRDTHLRLADYFTEQQLNTRKLEELPWQLAETSEWERLSALLSDLSFLRKAWEANVFEFHAYWSKIVNQSELKLIDSYRFVLEAPQNYPDSLWFVASLLSTAGHPKEALLLRESMVESAAESGDRKNLAVSFVHLAPSLMDNGEYDRAISYLHRAEETFRELHEKDLLQSLLGNLSAIFQMRGNLAKAVSLNEERQHICEELGDKKQLARCSDRKSNFLVLQGRTNEALTLLKEEHDLYSELGDKFGLANCLGNQASILRMQGKLEEATRLLQEKEHICRELNYKEGLAQTLVMQAGNLYDQGQIGMSLDMYDKAERILRELDAKPTLVVSYRNHAVAALAQGNFGKAMALNVRAEEIAVEIGIEKSTPSAAPFNYVKQLVDDLEPEENPESKAIFSPSSTSKC